MTGHILIAGGTGFIGRNLVHHLRAQNYKKITVISRMPAIDHITWHDLDKGIPNDVTAVVNLSGQNVLDPSRRWTSGFKQNVWNSRCNTSSALAKAIEKSPHVRTFVNIIGVSHYRPLIQKVYTEEDQVNGFDFMSRLCLEWENAATLSDTAKFCRGIKLRTGVVVGRDGGMIQSIWLPFKLGIGGPMGTGAQILPWIHIDDLCKIIQHCIESDCEGVFNAVAPEVCTNGEFSKTFASAMRRPCLFVVPEKVVELIFGHDRAVLLLSGAKIYPKRILENGFEFKYPTIKSACEDVVKMG